MAALPRLALVDRSGYRQLLSDRQNANDAANLVFLALIIAFCGIAVINTLAMATSARSREFSLLRLTGATVRQVRSMLRWELALIALVAVVLAAVASWSTLTGFSLGMAGESTPTIEPLTCAGCAGAGRARCARPVRPGAHPAAAQPGGRDDLRAVSEGR